MSGLVHVEPVLGTAVTIDVRWRDGEEPVLAEEAVVAGVRLLHEIDRLFSTARAGSQVSLLRHGVITLSCCPTVVSDVVLLCAEAEQLSRGWFDPWRLPGGFDPTGLVKGWAAREVGRTLTAHGVPHHGIDAGGDLSLTGSVDGDPAGFGWTVGLADPHRPDSLLTAVTVRDGAVATSGGHRRGSSAVDPHSGDTVERLASATVVGPDLAIADALATAATAAGATALAWLDAAAGYEALLVLPSGEVRTSAGWSETPLRCRAESTDSTR